MITSVPFQYRAAESGITEQLIRDVVFKFYEKIRNDAVLGPIFADAIGHDWDSHIERVILFWMTATRLERGYNGRNFMPAHLRHRSIRADHIPRWLALFRDTATEHCSSEGASVLIDIAERMAETLEIGIAKCGHQ